MSYKIWFEQHGKKHAKIMKKLTNFTQDEAIEYFQFENMVIKEPDFCPLYKENKKCHDIKILNCYLCACPNFRFNDTGFKNINKKSLKSYCSVDSVDGTPFESKDAIHQNCSECTLPHHEAYIQKIFDRDWFKMMKEVSI